MDTADRVWRALALSLAVFLALVLLLAFERQAAQTSETDGGPDIAHVVDIELTEFAIEPAEIPVPAGVPVTFDVRNTGSIEHDFTIAGVDGTASIASGQSATMEVAALEPGEYKVNCTIAGHESAGMTATLVAAEGTQADGSEMEGHDMAAVSDQGSEAAHPRPPEEMAKMPGEGVPTSRVESKGMGTRVIEPEIRHVRNTFITSSPRWLMTFTAILPDAESLSSNENGRPNGRA